MFQCQRTFGHTSIILLQSGWAVSAVSLAVMSFGQWLSTLSSYSVSMNYPPASQRHTAVQDRERCSEQWRMEWVWKREREEEVMAHFTQSTEEITGGLQTWHGHHGDASANNQMQICHLQRNWGRGGTQSSNRGHRWRNVSFCQIKRISGGDITKTAAMWSCWVHTLAQ